MRYELTDYEWALIPLKAKSLNQKNSTLTLVLVM
jgi:hypothetical protein